VLFLNCFCRKNKLMRSLPPNQRQISSNVIDKSCRIPYHQVRLKNFMLRFSF
jgi:hypothetical protein